MKKQITTERIIQCNKPDVTLIRRTLLIDVSILTDKNGEEVSNKPYSNTEIY
jgi:hypothetical protein